MELCYTLAVTVFHSYYSMKLHKNYLPFSPLFIWHSQGLKQLLYNYLENRSLNLFPVFWWVLKYYAFELFYSMLCFALSLKNTYIKQVLNFMVIIFLKEFQS